MDFPEKIDSEDIDIVMKEWRLVGYYVHVFEKPPPHVGRPNVWISDKCDHPSKATLSDLSALYTYRGDHYLRLHPIEDPQ